MYLHLVLVVARVDASAVPVSSNDSTKSYIILTAIVLVDPNKCEKNVSSTHNFNRFECHLAVSYRYVYIRVGNSSFVK